MSIGKTIGHARAASKKPAGGSFMMYAKGKDINKKYRVTYKVKEVG